MINADRILWQVEHLPLSIQLLWESRITRRSVTIYQRKQKILIAATCRYGITRQMDLDAGFTLIDADIENPLLGGACRQLLMYDRKCPFARRDQFGRAFPELSSARLAKAFGLSSDRNLYPGMRHVSLEHIGSRIKVAPWRHLRGSAFDPWPKTWPGKHMRVIPYEAQDEVWGLTVKDALAAS